MNWGGRWSFAGNIKELEVGRFGFMKCKSFVGKLETKFRFVEKLLLRYFE